MENNIPNPTAAMSLKSLQTNTENTERMQDKKKSTRIKSFSIKFLTKETKKYDV